LTSPLKKKFLTARPDPVYNYSANGTAGDRFWVGLRKELTMADIDEVYYCGHCRRQQDPKDGERCKICGKQTVSWNLRRESEETAHKRWKSING
jgi:hypothetical protein